MTKILLLEGDSGIGKSTLIYQQWLTLQPKTSGFYVKRIFNQEEVTGFSICDGTNFADFYQPVTAIQKKQTFITHQKRHQVTLFPFEKYGVDLLRQALHSDARLLVLDEIGGVELEATSFYEELLKVIEANVKLIGVFKSEKNYQIQKKKMDLPDVIDQRRQLILRKIAENEGRVVETTVENRLPVFLLIKDFMSECV